MDARHTLKVDPIAPGRNVNILHNYAGISIMVELYLPFIFASN